MKNFKHVSKWARKNQCTAFRIYDKDIPELPYAVDYYDGSFVVYGYDRPDTPLDPQLIASQLASAFEVPLDVIFYKTRSRQHGLSQYEKSDSRNIEKIVTEFGIQFIVNLSDYLDTGLFLDHRLTRKMVGEQSAGKRMLNLFCYTGSATVHAAMHQASETESVDLSNTYTTWAERNFALNQMDASKHRVIREDVLRYVKCYQGDKFDVIFLDPPSFSNSKKMTDSFDIQRHHEELITDCLQLLSPKGILYFSNNLRTFKMSDQILHKFKVTNLTPQTLPVDFRNQRIHNTWTIAF